MARKLKTKVVEHLGSHKYKGAYLDFEDKLNAAIDTLKHEHVISVDVTASEIVGGTRYIGVILYSK